MKVVILALGILLIGHTASGQINDPSYQMKVKELMDIQMGQGLITDQMTQQILPDIPVDKREDFKKDMRLMMDKSMAKISDIYMEVYTKEEVDALLGFYNSPIGQQIQKKLPEVMKKSTVLQQELIPEIMPIMEKYLR